MTSQGKAQRRSLKECFKTLLNRRQDDQVTSVKKDPSLPLLPTFSTLSILPDFDSSRFDVDKYGIDNTSQYTIIPYRPSLSRQDVRNAYRYQSDLGQLARSCGDLNSSISTFDFSRFENTSAGSLLPKTSLNQLVTPDSIHFQSPLSQLAHACHVPSIYRHGVSLQASLASFNSDPTSRMRSASTLRLQRSTQDLRPNSEIGLAPLSPRQTSITPTEGRSLHRSRSRSLTPETPRRQTELDKSLASINHFSSFCVLDAATPGCPVTATSQDLRRVFEIGEEFCLNTAGVEGADLDIVTGEDTNGNAVVHLVVYSPLVNPSSGRSRFVLASLLDITSFITDTASVPDLETISEESLVEEELRTPPRADFLPVPREWSSENLYSIPETPTQPPKEDIWLDIATEETRRSRSIKSAPSTPRSSSTSSREDILDQFLESLKGMYSDFFLLGKSPLDEHSYEICNVSPRVHAGREYIDGHLTKTSPADRAFLEGKLTQEESFSMQVRWGNAGELKQLYCIPLYGKSNVTWVCFLVNENKNFW